MSSDPNAANRSSTESVDIFKEDTPTIPRTSVSSATSIYYGPQETRCISHIVATAQSAKGKEIKNTDEDTELDVPSRLLPLIRLFAKFKANDRAYDIEALRARARQRQRQKVRPEVDPQLKQFEAAMAEHEKKANKIRGNDLEQDASNIPASPMENTRKQSIRVNMPSPVLSSDCQNPQNENTSKLVPPQSPRLAAEEYFPCQERGIKRRRTESIEPTQQVSCPRDFDLLKSLSSMPELQTKQNHSQRKESSVQVEDREVIPERELGDVPDTMETDIEPGLLLSHLTKKGKIRPSKETEINKLYAWFLVRVDDLESAKRMDTDPMNVNDNNNSSSYQQLEAHEQSQSALTVQEETLDDMMENLIRVRDRRLEEIMKSDLPSEEDYLESDQLSDSSEWDESDESDDPQSSNSSSEQASMNSDVLNIDKIAEIHGIPMPLAEVMEIATRYKLPTEMFIKGRPKLQHRLSLVVPDPNRPCPVNVEDLIEHDHILGTSPRSASVPVASLYEAPMLDQGTTKPCEREPAGSLDQSRKPDTQVYDIDLHKELPIPPIKTPSKATDPLDSSQTSFEPQTMLESKDTLKKSPSRSSEQRGFRQSSWGFPAEKFRSEGCQKSRLLRHHINSLRPQDESIQAYMSREQGLRDHVCHRIDQNLFPGASTLPMRDALGFHLLLISNLQREISSLKQDCQNEMATNKELNKVIISQKEEIQGLHLAVEHLERITQ